MKHRPYYNYYDITIVTVFERCVKSIVTFCAQIIVLKWNGTLFVEYCRANFLGRIVEI